MARRPEFHTLQVEAIDRLTDDAVALTFALPGELADDYQFSPGQHLTVRCLAAGDDTRRTYSLCSAPGRLRIGVKRVAGGVFSGHAMNALRVGDAVEVMTPTGRFTTTVDASAPRHRAAIAAGSGITPVLSIMASTLAAEPASTFTLVYGNRAADSVMFLDEIGDLKDRFHDRLAIFHVLSREARDSSLLSGRLDRAKIDEMLEAAVDPVDVAEWFLCGPFDVIDAARAALRARGVPDDRVHFELFHVDTATPGTAATAVAASAAASGSAAAGSAAAGSVAAGSVATAETTAADVTVVLAGRSTTLKVEPTHDVLHAVMPIRPDVPYGCTNGMCGTCRAKLVEGNVEMDHCYALDDGQLTAGFVLTCQAKPRSQRVVLDYDA